MTVRNASRVLGGLLVLVVLTRWSLVRIAFTRAPWTPLGGSALLFVALTVAAATGLLRVRRWGFFVLYGLVPVATLLHGIALVPFVTRLVPAGGSRTGAVVLANGAVLAAAASVHWALGRSGSWEAGTTPPA